MSKGWRKNSLGEVSELITRGISPVYTDKTGLIVLNQKCIRDHFVNHELGRTHDNKVKKVNEERLIQIGDVLVNSTGTGTLGRVAQVRANLNATVDSHVTIVRPTKGLFYNDFFGYAMISLEEEIEKGGEGCGGQTELSRSKLKDEYFISFPESIPEQKRIVAILDEAFAAIDLAKANTGKNLQNAKDLFESYLQNVFSDNISGSRNEKLEDICELIVDCEHKTAPTQAEGYPSIRTPNIGKGVLILDNVRRVSENTYKEWTKRAIPQADDLILAREAPAGNVAIIPDNLKVCLGQRTVLIRTFKDKLNPSYLSYLLLSKDVQRQLLLHSKGATVEHINMKDIRAFKIFNRPTIKEQLEIVSKIDSLLKNTLLLEDFYIKKINDLEELKKSILQKAFAGELTYSTEKITA